MFFKQYKHGGDVVGAARAFNLSLRDILDFSANINPLGPSPAALAAIKENLEIIRHYPDPFCRDLRRALSSYLAVPPECLLPGNGVSELIYLITRVVGCRRALVTAPTFTEYAEAVTAAGGEVREVPLREEEGFALSPVRLKKEMPGADMVFICNPNNPTGRVEKKSVVRSIIEAARETGQMLVVDEAFIDFVEKREQHTILPLVEKYQHLVILYSLTKFFGIPGLRLGVLIAAPAIVARLEAARDPWSVNWLAQVAGEAALSDGEYVKATRDLIAREREYLFRSIAQVPNLRPFPTDANYLLVKITDQHMSSPVFAAETAKRGVLVRDCSTFSGLGENYIRVAVKTRKENVKLLNVLSEIMKGA